MFFHQFLADEASCTGACGSPVRQIKCWSHERHEPRFQLYMVEIEFPCASDEDRLASLRSGADCWPKSLPLLRHFVGEPQIRNLKQPNPTSNDHGTD